MIRRKRLFNLARKNRCNMTNAETTVWKMIRCGQMGYKFRRQYTIEPYIVDFICLEKKMIIECDGGQHTEEKDLERTLFLKNKGYKVIRFWNNEVLKNAEGVRQEIYKGLSEIKTPPS